MAKGSPFPSAYAQRLTLAQAELNTAQKSLSTAIQSVETRKLASDHAKAAMQTCLEDILRQRAVLEKLLSELDEDQEAHNEELAIRAHAVKSTIRDAAINCQTAADTGAEAQRALIESLEEAEKAVDEHKEAVKILETVRETGQRSI